MVTVVKKPKSNEELQTVHGKIGEQLFGLAPCLGPTLKCPSLSSGSCCWLQLPASMLEGGSDGAGDWVLATHVRDSDCIPSSRLQLWPSPASVVVGIWGVNWRIGGFSLSVSEIKKQKNVKVYRKVELTDMFNLM